MVTLCPGQSGHKSNAIFSLPKPTPAVAQWLTPASRCNPSSLGGQGRQITRSGDQGHPGQNGETPSLLKIQKLAGCGDVHLYSQLLRRLRQENRLNQGVSSCSELRSCHCTLAWQQSETLSQNKKGKKKYMQEVIRMMTHGI